LKIYTLKSIIQSYTPERIGTAFNSSADTLCRMNTKYTP
jgi:hypothetical protein